MHPACLDRFPELQRWEDTLLYTNEILHYIRLLKYTVTKLTLFRIAKFYFYLSLGIPIIRRRVCIIAHFIDNAGEEVSLFITARYLPVNDDENLDAGKIPEAAKLCLKRHSISTTAERKEQWMTMESAGRVTTRRIGISAVSILYDAIDVLFFAGYFATQSF